MFTQILRAVANRFAGVGCRRLCPVVHYWSRPPESDGLHAQGCETRRGEALSRGPLSRASMGRRVHVAFGDPELRSVLRRRPDTAQCALLTTICPAASMVVFMGSIIAALRDGASRQRIHAAGRIRVRPSHPVDVRLEREPNRSHVAQNRTPQRLRRRWFQHRRSATQRPAGPGSDCAPSRFLASAAVGSMRRTVCDSKPTPACAAAPGGALSL